MISRGATPSVDDLALARIDDLTFAWTDDLAFTWVDDHGADTPVRD